MFFNVIEISWDFSTKFLQICFYLGFRINKIFPPLEERASIRRDNRREMDKYGIETTYFKLGSDIYRQE